MNIITVHHSHSHDLEDRVTHKVEGVGREHEDEEVLMEEGDGLVSMDDWELMEGLVDQEQVGGKEEEADLEEVLFARIFLKHYEV